VALARALARHGLDDLYAAPPARFRSLAPEVKSRNLLGVRVDEGAAAPEVELPVRAAVEPTPELRTLAADYRELVGKLFAQAVAQGTLLRLADEYERTERRARALENVLLPELEDRLRFMGEQLEAMDQEDVVRVRFRR
jgi:V/A-type H+-transporting ATPase subunit D